MTCQTPRSTPAARTRTRTSSSPISGLSMFPSSRTSGEPYLYRTIAFMGFLQVWLFHALDKTNTRAQANLAPHKPLSRMRITLTFPTTTARRAGRARSGSLCWSRSLGALVRPRLCGFGPRVSCQRCDRHTARTHGCGGSLVGIYVVLSPGQGWLTGCE